MELNVVVETLIKIIGTDKIEYISGKVLNVGTNECELSEKRGSVYGFAIRLKTQNDVVKVFNSIIKERRNINNVSDWQPIKEDYYPLYWGRDTNMGARIFSHTRSMKSTGTIQLNTISTVLRNYEIVYGAVPCLNYEKNEEILHDRYVQLLCTVKSSNDSISTLELIGEEKES